MLTAEIKINGELVAEIEAVNVKVVSDEPGDFVGNRAIVCEYRCVLKEPDTLADLQFYVTHDRRFGWEGLLNKITEAAIPTVVETISTKYGALSDDEWERVYGYRKREE